MHAVHLTKDDFEKEVLQADIPVLVDFFAEWCPPCKAVGPVVDEFASEADGKFKVCKLDVDQGGDIAGKYGVMTVPTFILFKNGEVVQQETGAISKDKMKEMVEGQL